MHFSSIFLFSFWAAVPGAGPDAGLLPAPERFAPTISDPLLTPAPRAKRELSSWDEAQQLLKETSTDERSAQAGVVRAQGEWRQSLGLLLPNARLSINGIYDVLNPSVPAIAGSSAFPEGQKATVPVGTASLAASQAIVDVGACKGTVGLVGQPRSRRSQPARHPTQLARRKLTAQDVTRALTEQNIQVAAGQVGQPPSNQDQPYQLAVRARGRLIEPEEFADIVVSRTPEGEVTRLRDIGRTELGAENYGQLMRFTGLTGVGIGIFQLPTANALDVRDTVLKEMERLSKQFPPGLEYKPATDTTLAVRASIHEVIITLVEARAAPVACTCRPNSSFATTRRTSAPSTCAATATR